MHKSVVFTFGLLASSLVMLAAMPFLTNNSFLLNTVMAQGNEYDSKPYNNNDYNDKKISLYPTKVNKYECQRGLFEGFFVGSVEFCQDVPKVNVNGIAAQRPQSPTGPQVIQVVTGVQETTGPSSPNQINEPNMYFRDGNLATTNTTSYIASAAFCNPGDVVVEGFYQLINKQDNPILGFINPIIEDKDAYTTALISTNVTLQILHYAPTPIPNLFFILLF